MDNDIKINHSIKKEYMSLEKKAPAPGSPEYKEQMKKACKDFEALYMQKVLKKMVESSGFTSRFGKSVGGEFFSEMYLSQVAKEMSEGEGGLGDVMYSQMTGDYSVSTDNDIKMRSLGKLKTNLFDMSTHNSIIEEAAEKHGVDKALIKAVIETESAGDYSAISDKGAKGLMQLMDSTAGEMGVQNPFNIRQNIDGGTKYLKKMLDKYDNNVKLALAAYNAGPDAVDKHNGIPPFKETEEYVEKIMNKLDSE